MILVSTEVLENLLQGNAESRLQLGDVLEDLTWKGKKLCVSIHSVQSNINILTKIKNWPDQLSTAFHEIIPNQFSHFRNANSIMNSNSIQFDLAMDISVAEQSGCNSILTLKKYPKEFTHLQFVPILGKSN